MVNRLETGVRNTGMEDYLVIPNAVYRGEKGTYNFFRKMTPEMTQEELAENYEEENRKGNPFPADAPLIISIGLQVGDPMFLDKNTNKFWQLVRDGCVGDMNTLTRLVYHPDSVGIDEIIHNYKTSDEYTSTVHLVGSEGFIDAEGLGHGTKYYVLEELLGEKNKNKLNFNFASRISFDCSMNMTRHDRRPSEIDERILTFKYLYGDPRFLINCMTQPFPDFNLHGEPYKGRAFRVQRVD